MQKDSPMPNKYKTACSDTAFVTGMVRKKAGRKYIPRKANKDFQHCFFPEHCTIKTGLHKGMGNGNLKAPGVTM